jgi:hypothetical protein
VVIPAFRASATIGRALASVAAQTLRPREAIVVDDGSDDGTAEAAEAARAALGETALNVLRQPHAGAGAARNRAVAAAGQPYLAFLDADDEWLPEKMSRSMAAIEEAGATLVAHDGWIVDGARVARNECAKRFRAARDPFVALYRKGYIDTSTVVVRRDAVLAAGGFDPGLLNAQDFDLWLAVLRTPGARFVVFDEPLSRYYVSDSGIMSHTERRLRCGLAIAGRYARDLEGHPGSALASLCYRVGALHYEAVAAFLAKRRRAKAILAALPFPARLAVAAVRFLAGGSSPRANFLSALAGGATEKVA